MAKKYKNIFFLFNCRVKKLIHLVKVFWLKFKVILLDQMNRKFNFAKKIYSSDEAKYWAFEQKQLD